MKILAEKIKINQKVLLGAAPGAVVLVAGDGAVFAMHPDLARKIADNIHAKADVAEALERSQSAGQSIPVRTL